MLDWHLNSFVFFSSCFHNYADRKNSSFTFVRIARNGAFFCYFFRSQTKTIATQIIIILWAMSILSNIFVIVITFKKWNRQTNEHKPYTNWVNRIFPIVVDKIFVCALCIHSMKRQLFVAIELNWNVLNRTASTNESSQTEKKPKLKGFLLLRLHSSYFNLVSFCTGKIYIYI